LRGDFGEDRAASHRVGVTDITLAASLAFMRPLFHPKNLPRLGASVLVLCGLSACAADPVPKAAAPAAPACSPAALEAEALRAVNAFRAAARTCGSAGRFDPAKPVRWSEALAQLAASHAQDMAARNLMTHDDAQGRAPADRATAAGYAWSVFAENVAGHPGGLSGVMRSWEASPGHCANLMNPEVTEIGLACSPGGPRTKYRAYWAMELAKPR
jgi:uncharacterized protein YkwD